MATAPLMPSLIESFAQAHPFPHVVLDRFFADDRVSQAAAEVRERSALVDPEFYGQKGKAGVRDFASMGEATRALIDEMNGPAFVRWLEGVTGIADLHPDPSLTGGGVHQIYRGGFLKVHTDFNWHAGMKMHRRVNVLLYLNDGWRDEWGGKLELWERDMSARAVSVAPLLDRLVIFSTTDDSYHGHPDPLACPANVTRASIALYYYSDAPAPAQAFGRSGMTNYRARPGEHLGSLRHKAHRLLLRFPAARRMLGR